MADGSLLRGKVAVVTGGGAGFGRALALGLADAGAAVAVLGPGRDAGEQATAREIEQSGGRASAIRTGFAKRRESEDAFASASSLGPIHLVVHAHVDPLALEARELESVNDATWDATCEATIRSALFVCQAAHTQMHERGGRIVLVTPTLSLSGAAGFVALSSAYEAIRILAKSAARRWGALGITVNCIAPNAAQAALPGLRARRGSFVLLTSPAGMEGSATLSVYAMVKGAQRAFVKSLAQEWGRFGINVNALSPLAATPALVRAYAANPALEARLHARIPLGRVGDPEQDIGAAAVMMLSDASRYMTGQTWVVDGGRFTGL